MSSDEPEKPGLLKIHRFQVLRCRINVLGVNSQRCIYYL